MPKILFLFLYFVFSNTFEQYVRSTCEQASEQDSSIKVEINSIRKSCEENLDKNIYDYFLCRNWVVDQRGISDILSKGRKNVHDESLIVISGSSPSWVSADVQMNGISKRVKINAMSYYYLIKGKQSELYTFNVEQQQAVEKYFLRKFTEADDERYDTELAAVREQLIDRKVDLSFWKAKYSCRPTPTESIEYTIHVDEPEISIVTEGKKIICIPHISNNILYIYFDGQRTASAALTSPLLSRVRDGDLLFQLFTKKGKHHIRHSPAFDRKTKISGSNRASVREVHKE